MIKTEILKLKWQPSIVVPTHTDTLRHSNTISLGTLTTWDEQKHSTERDRPCEAANGIQLTIIVIPSIQPDRQTDSQPIHALSIHLSNGQTVELSLASTSISCRYTRPTDHSSKLSLVCYIFEQSIFGVAYLALWMCVVCVRVMRAPHKVTWCFTWRGTFQHI